MPRWEVMLFRKKGERLGVIEARDEKEATAKAATELTSRPSGTGRSLSPSLRARNEPRRKAEMRFVWRHRRAARER